MNIILTGFMGTGKTSVGRRLARRLGWRFCDLDLQIEAAARMPVAKIFAERGEPVFRRLERRALYRALRDSEQVIATGGGAFVDARNRAALKASGPVVCLTAKPQAILQRVGGRIEARPLLRGPGEPLARIRALLAQRAKAYAQADLTIDTTGLSIDEVVERVWDAVSPAICESWNYLLSHSRELGQRYGGKYVAVCGNRIIGTGDTQLQAYQKATSRLTASREMGVYYIPLPEESLTALPVA